MTDATVNGTANNCPITLAIGNFKLPSALPATFTFAVNDVTKLRSIN